jgi:hypothetical protein
VDQVVSNNDEDATRGFHISFMELTHSCSILDMNSSKEHRTTHEAQKVIKGTKFAANSWIHLYDVVETQRRGCT